MDILIIVAVILVLAAASNILCFAIGAKVGQAVKNGEEIKVLTLGELLPYGFTL